MSNAKQKVMEGIQVIADQFLARGKDVRIAPMVAKITAAIEAQPDSFFASRLYPTPSTMDADAPMKIWKETAAQLVKGA
jgi:hypothetical protein